MKEENDKLEKKKFQVTFRIFQAIFFGILALGISSTFGDVGSYVQSPISTFSITTTIFGIIGSIITGMLANKSKNW